MTARSLKSEFAYARNLIEAGWNGALSARKGTDTRAFMRVLPAALLAPAAIGAGFGALSASLSRSRRSGHTSAMGGFIGSLAGLAAGAAWASRGLAGAAARGAIRKINTVRDARWLEKHPIDYA